MSGEARKLHLVEAILKVDDEALLTRVESVLARNEMKPVVKKSWKDLTGFLSEEEANEWIKNIEEGCEQINPDDRK